jgi:iron complex transport system ATP-binding protein
VIACAGVHKSFGERRVLDAVDASVRPGCVVGLIGPNGAGKSTLLRVLAGELTPDAGTVTLDGVPLKQLRVRELALARALLPQSVELAFDFTVRELVLLGRSAHSPVETKACAEVVQSCLEVVGLERRANDLATSLSGGERQRAHLARVLAQIGLGKTGRYLVLDEPVSSQDPAWQLRLLEILRGVARRGAGVVMVLHDVNLAARSCDELVLMHEGRVAHRGVPSEALEPARLREVFDVEASVDADPASPSAPRVSFRLSEQNPLSARTGA